MHSIKLPGTCSSSQSASDHAPHPATRRGHRHARAPYPEQVTTATVREWHDDLGWGVLDSPETPGGCWAHFSHIETPRVGSVNGREVYGYKTLSTGEHVELEWETSSQDGFDYRATAVRRDR